MEKVLVLVQDYPDDKGKKSLMYVHARNLYYLKSNIDVTVLNFSSNESYYVDGIRVICYEDYKSEEFKDTVLICHAPNIRSHYRFIRKFGKKYSKKIFFFHGHEIVRINDAYPKPYDYMNSVLKEKVQDLYDGFKLRIWKKYFEDIDLTSKLIFVSNSLYKDFLHYTKVSPEKIDRRVKVINNGVGRVFEIEQYDKNLKKEYDFITIRSNFDGSTYCIDVIRRLAIQNPDYKFLLIGKGEFFNYYTIPENMTVLNTVLSHEDMLCNINKSKWALMPTRRDSQGVMSCELATYGIPLITSDIEVCQEIFSGMRNVFLCDLENVKSIGELLGKLEYENIEKNNKFFEKSTVANEVELIKNI